MSAGVARSTALPRLPVGYVPAPWLDAVTSGPVPPPLVVLRAPRGFGKTSGVVGWLREDPPPRHHHVWVGAPHRAISAEEYWELVRERAVGAGLDELEGGDWSRLDRELSRRRQRLVLVLDDIDRVRGHGLADQVVALAGEHEQLTVVVTSRSARSLATLATVADGVLIEPRHLAWRPEQVGEHARLLGLDLDAGEARRLAVGTMGWPALVRALLRDLDRDPSGELRLGTEGLESYLRVATLDAELAQWESLAALALAGEFDSGLAAELLGPDRARTTMASLTRLGLAPVDRVHGVHAVPEPLAGVLSTILAERSPTRYRDASATVARWRGLRAAPASTLRHALAAGDHRTAAAVLRRHGPGLVADHRELAARALHLLPDELVAASARLLVTRDYILHVGTADRARAAFVADLLVPEPSASPEQRLSLQQVLSLRSGGMYDGVRRLAERRDLGAAIADSGWSPAVVADVPTVLLSWARSELAALPGPVSTFAYAEAYRWARHLGDEEAAGEAAAGAALSHAAAGHLVSSSAWSACVPDDATEQARVLDAAARTVVAVDAARPDLLPSAEALLALPSHLADLHVVSLVAHGDAALHGGDVLRAAREIERYRVALGESPAAGMVEHTLVAVLLELYLAGGELERARRLLAEVDRDGDRLPVQRAQLHLQQGAYRAVLELVERLDPRTPRQTVQLALLSASAAHRSGDAPAAADAFQTALGVAGRTGLLRPFQLLPAADLAVLSEDGRAFTGALDAVRLLPHGLLGEVGERVVLTPREQDVLTAIAGGSSMATIAARQYVSPNTVKSQVRTLYRKLGATGREDAVRRARDLGLLPPEPDG